MNIVGWGENVKTLQLPGEKTNSKQLTILLEII